MRIPDNATTTESVMQTVLVATDLTPTSETAIERAAFASRALGAGLHMLHVVPERMPPILPELMPPVIGRARVQKAENALRYQAQSLGGRLGPRVSCHVIQGDRSRGIVRESEEIGAVLTVLGHRTKRRRSRRLMGTTPERSLRLIRGAVLLVCDDSPKETLYRKALLAPDGGVKADNLMPHLRHLAPDAAVHSIDPLRYRGNGRSMRNAADHVRAMRRALDADLLVIGIPRDESLNPLKFRRLLTPLVRLPECDTLIVPQECDVVPLEKFDSGRNAARYRAAS